MMASVGSQERYGDYFEAARQAGDLLNRKKRKQPKAETLSNYSLLPLEERLFRNVEGISSYDLPKMLVELINNGLTDQTFKIAETGRTERVVDVLLALTDRLDREKIERDRRIFGEIDFDPYGSPSTYGQSRAWNARHSVVARRGGRPRAHAVGALDGERSADEEPVAWSSTRG